MKHKLQTLYIRRKSNILLILLIRREIVRDIQTYLQDLVVQPLAQQVVLNYASGQTNGEPPNKRRNPRTNGETPGQTANPTDKRRTPRTNGEPHGNGDGNETDRNGEGNELLLWR